MANQVLKNSCLLDRDRHLYRVIGTIFIVVVIALSSFAGALAQDAGTPVPADPDAEQSINTPPAQTGSKSEESTPTPEPAIEATSEQPTSTESVSVESDPEGGNQSGTDANGTVAEQPTPTAPPIVQPALSCTTASSLSIQIGSSTSIECEVTVFDERADAYVLIEASPGWSIRTGDTLAGETIRDGPISAGGVQPVVRHYEIETRAPVMSGATGVVTVHLLQRAFDGVELAKARFDLTANVPESWTLACAPAAAPVIPGTSVEISCTIPADAWKLHGDAPTLAYATPDGVFNGHAPIDSAAAEFEIDIPCALAGEVADVKVTATLANGFALQADVALPIDGAPAATPVLTVVSVTNGTARWTGTEYEPSISTLRLDVSAPASSCVDSDWAIQLTVAQLSDGDTDVLPTIILSGGTATNPNVEVSSNEILSADVPLTVASGNGASQVEIILAITLPPDSPAGSYSGALHFDLSIGP